MTNKDGFASQVQLVRTSHGDYLEHPVYGWFRLIMISPRTVRRCNIIMGISAAVALVMRLGMMFAAPALGKSSMTLDQKASVVISVSITGLLAVALFLIAFCIGNGQSAKTATLKVVIMFALLGAIVYYSYQPVMDMFMYVLAHNQR